MTALVDWQVELRSTVTGAGTVHPIEFGGITLGGADVKTNDVVLGHTSGSYAGRDYAGARIITVAYTLRGTAAVVGANLLTLETVWAVSESTNLSMHMRLPGLGHLAFTGRPRGLLSDLKNLQVGNVRALGTFFCGDPTMTVTA